MQNLILQMIHYQIIGHSPTSARRSLGIPIIAHWCEIDVRDLYVNGLKIDFNLQAVAVLTNMGGGGGGRSIISFIFLK